MLRNTDCPENNKYVSSAWQEGLSWRNAPAVLIPFDVLPDCESHGLTLK